MLLQLPPELLERILLLCQLPDLKNLSCCSSEYNEASSLQKLLWRVVSIPSTSLLHNNISGDRRIYCLNFADTLSLEVYSSGKANEGLESDQNRPPFLADEKKKKKAIIDKGIPNISIILQHCNPEVLHICFLPPPVVSEFEKFERLKEIHFYWYVGDNNVLKNLFPKLLSTLQILQITGGKITDTGLSSLNSLLNLRSLSIANCSQITDAALSGLASMILLKKFYLRCCSSISDSVLDYVTNLLDLEELTIFGFDVTDQGLGKISSLQKIRQLNIKFGRNVTDNGLHFLSRLVELESLQIHNMNMFGHRITEEGIGHISNLVKLRELDLKLDHSVTDDVIRGIANLPRLKKLKVYRSGITDVGLSYIGSIFSLKDLDLSQCTSIVGTGMIHLKNIDNLEKLVISGLGQEVCRHVGSLTSLQELTINGSHMSEYMEHLCNLVNLKKLHAFGQHHRLTNMGLYHIGRITSLRELGLGICRKITDKGISYLQSLTNLEILDMFIIANCRCVSRCVTGGYLKYIGKIKQLKELTITKIVPDRKANRSQKPSIQTFPISNLPLTKLVTDTDTITDEVMVDVGRITSLKNLRIARSGVTEEGLQHMKNLKLKQLGLSGLTHLTDTALLHVVCLKTLIELDISNCDKVTNLGIKQLIGLQKLEMLNLSCTKVTNRGLSYVGKIVSLKAVNLSDCKKITEVGLEYLSKLVYLQKVDLTGCRLLDISILAHVPNVIYQVNNHPIVVNNAVIRQWNNNLIEFRNHHFPHLNHLNDINQIQPRL